MIELMVLAATAVTVMGLAADMVRGVRREETR